MTKEQDWHRFCKLIEMASELTASSKLSADAIGMMFKMLQRFDFEQVYRAVMSQIEASPFMPKVADIIKTIEGTPEEIASLAWAKIIQALQLIGTYKSITFEDPAIHYAIERLGGWMFLGRADEDQMRFIAKDFERYYKEAIRDGINWKTVPAFLGGYHDPSRSLTDQKPIQVEQYLIEVNQVPRTLPRLEAPKQAKLIPINVDYARIGKPIT